MPGSFESSSNSVRKLLSAFPAQHVDVRLDRRPVLHLEPGRREDVMPEQRHLLLQRALRRRHAVDPAAGPDERRLGRDQRREVATQDVVGHLRGALGVQQLLDDVGVGPRGIGLQFPPRRSQAGPAQQMRRLGQACIGDECSGHGCSGHGGPLLPVGVLWNGLAPSIGPPGGRVEATAGGPAAAPRSLPSGPPSPSLQMERGPGGEVPPPLRFPLSIASDGEGLGGEVPFPLRFPLSIASDGEGVRG